MEFLSSSPALKMKEVLAGSKVRGLSALVQLHWSQINIYVDWAIVALQVEGYSKDLRWWS